MNGRPMRLTRRAALAGAALLPSMAHAQAKLEDTVVIRTTGGVFEAALKRHFFEPFTKETGVRVVPVAASDSEMQAKTAAMAQAGRVEWDIIAPQMSELPNLQRFLVDLGDCSSIPAVAGSLPGTCGRWRVLYLVGAQVLAYDTTAFPGRKPQTWADFWDVQGFPGRRARSNRRGPFAPIVSKLFPRDLDRAYRKLDEIRPHIAVWWRTGDQSQAMWRNDDIQLALMWCGRAFATRRSGVPLAWSYDGTFEDFGTWAILKDCPHPNAARAFLQFYLSQPELATAFSREIGYALPNPRAAALLTEQERQDLITTPETMAKIVHMDPAWVVENRARTLDRWNRWISS